MRIRRRATALNPVPEGISRTTVVRSFAPESLDLDQLADAIGRLVTDDSKSPITARKLRKSDLLLLPHRASHVVEAPEAD